MSKDEMIKKLEGKLEQATAMRLKMTEFLEVISDDEPAIISCAKEWIKELNKYIDRRQGELDNLRE